MASGVVVDRGSETRISLRQSRTGFVIPSVTFCAISDAVTAHKTVAAGLHWLFKFTHQPIPKPLNDTPPRTR